MKTIGVHQNTILNADAPVRSLADLPSDAFGRLLDG
jgi:hypothetical protein